MKTINDYAELVKEKHALNKTIAPVETDLTDASRGYHIGEQFIYDGELNKAKTEIAQHDALVLNTNYEPADNLTEQIKNAGGGTGTDPRLDVFENNIASVETDETDASKEYQVGEQLILNNILYDVIAPISEHDVITTTGSGANIAPADPISSQVETLTNQVKDMNNVYGSKNLLIIRQYTRTYNGVSITVNDDGSISFKGTPSTNFNLSANTRQIPEEQLENDWVKPFLGKECIFSSNIDYDVTSANITIAYKMTASDTIHYIQSGSRFTFNEIPYSINVSWYLPTTLSFNTTWKPMIRLASIEDDTYEPYAKTNQQLTQDTTALLDNTEVNGAVNMLDFTHASEVRKGYTFTNTDGVVQVTGSRASGETGNADHYVTITLPKGTYKVSGCPSGGSENTWRLLVNINDGAKYAFDYGDGAIFTLTEDSTLKVYCTIMANYSDTVNITFKPMITVPSYNGDYVPYAKSNKELTEELTVESTDIASLVSFSTLTSYQARKYGKVVELYFAGTLSEAVNRWTDFLTVPDGFRPSHYVQIVSFNTYNSCKNLQLASSGGIQSGDNLASGDFIRFTVTYIID